MKIIKQYGVSFLVAGAFILNLVLPGENVVFSQERGGVLGGLAPETPIKPIMIRIRKAQERTPEDMEEMEATLAPSYEESEVPFMPTMDPSEYAALKVASEGDAEQARPLAPESSAPEPLAPPLLKGISIEGANQTHADGKFPPDTHGAVGDTHYVQVVNNKIFRYNKLGAFLSSLALNSLFGTIEPVIDPRVVYDQTWKRWVIVGTRRSTSSSDTVLRFYLAVSKTSDPTGSYFIYSIPFSGNGGDWWYYPQLGMNQDAVIITGNIYDLPTGGLKGGAMVAFAKARMYNGLSYSVPFFYGLDGSICPPIVLDQNKNAYLIANYAGSYISLWRGENLSNAFQATLVLQADVDVTNYAIPGAAPQLGTTQKLDTLDTRFVNASTQYGDSLWNVHTISFTGSVGGLATPKFYQIDTEGTGANMIKQQGFFYESSYSYDFNASIAANTSGEAFVVWSTTDVANPVSGLRHNARIRFSGRQPADLLNVITAGSVLFTSSTALTGNASTTPGVQRWGDYSAVSLDPNSASGANRQAWITNEKVNSASVWGSRIGRIGY